jgi:hypothetical protein
MLEVRIWIVDWLDSSWELFDIGSSMALPVHFETWRTLLSLICWFLLTWNLKVCFIQRIWGWIITVSKKRCNVLNKTSTCLFWWWRFAIALVHPRIMVQNKSKHNDNDIHKKIRQRLDGKIQWKKEKSFFLQQVKRVHISSLLSVLMSPVAEPLRHH